MLLTWDGIMSEIAPVFTGLKEKATGLRVKTTYHTINRVKAPSAAANANFCQISKQ